MRAALVGAAAALAAIPVVTANAVPARVFTVAVYGDSPYGTSPTDTAEYQATPAFVDSVNADPQVGLVVHVGDIHSGKQPCTEAYDRSIYDAWTRFADPLVYTPGDNEWADCHKPGEGGGDPLANLDLIRSIFFATPGETLGGGRRRVVSQALAYDLAHPADAQYVENTMWQQKDVLFVTVNVPGGSNNDTDPWFQAPSMSDAQANEVAARTGADLRWLDQAFAVAGANGAAAVVVVTQADMWDLDGKTAAHLTQYEPIVASIASHTTAFGKPVLMFNGDSHAYRSDNPLSPSAPCVTEVAGGEGPCGSEAANHPGYDVPNFHRVVVHGSTFPLEWLKLTVDAEANHPAGANAFGPFSWTRMTQS